ncbi:AMP-binding protein [Couchioplanes azureus]|uniref:AMP-binding protein n=1 Tax=Couchioplanes caeruleus TaxID=56438 RepID=UPI00167092C1|nr:AMP-binding protein [Couchioplanes caeruleus]
MTSIAGTDPATVVDLVAQRRGGPGTLTVLGGDAGVRSVTWAAVHDRARRLTTLLRGRGVGSGSRVGLLADTGVGLVTAIQGVWLSGAAVTVLPMPVRRADAAYVAQLRRTIADGRLGLVLVGVPLAGLRPELAAAAPTADLDAAVADAAVYEPATPATPAPDDLAVLQYTSGSTRQPRGVPVTHGNLAANLASIRVATRHAEVHGCLLSWLPLYHDMGLVGFAALPMSCGCPLVLQPPAVFAARPLGWLEAVAAYRATATAAPNFAWGLATRLLGALPRHDTGLRLDSLRFALTGGEPVDPVLMTRFAAAARRHGLDPSVLICGYGLAEATLAVSFSRPGAGLEFDVVDPDELELRGYAVPAGGPRPGRALARLGPPVPGCRVRVVHRVTGRPLGERRVGHVQVAGAGVVRGYWGEPPGPPGGWRATGDLGYLADGELVVCGRVKDVLFAAGRNVYPQDVEAVAGEVPGVRPGGVAAFAVPDDGDKSGHRLAGDRLAVAVESRAWSDGPKAAAVRSAVTAAVAAELGLTPAAVAVLAPGRLGRTSSGKLRRAETRRQFLAGELEPESPPAGPAGTP